MKTAKEIENNKNYKTPLEQSSFWFTIVSPTPNIVSDIE